MELTSHTVQCASAGSIPPSWEPVDSENDLPPPSFAFSQQVGSTLRFPQDCYPVDFFRHLLDDNLVDQLVDETNYIM